MGELPLVGNTAVHFEAEAAFDQEYTKKSLLSVTFMQFEGLNTKILGVAVDSVAFIIAVQQMILALHKPSKTLLAPMATPPGTPPPPFSPSPPPPPPAVPSQSAPGEDRPVVHVDPATGKADDPHKKKLRTYLGIVARDKVDVTYETWKEVPLNLISLKHLMVRERRKYFKLPESGGDRNGHLQPTRTVWMTLFMKNMTLASRNGSSFVKPAKTSRGRMCGKRHRPSISKTLPPTCYLMGKKLEKTSQSGSTKAVIDPSSPIRRHVKWKLACTKKTGQMTSEAAKEIAEKILSHFQLRIIIIFVYSDSLEKQAPQGSFVPYGQHPDRVRAAGAGVIIKQYFGSAPRTSHSSSSMSPEELEQLTQQTRDQLEESITEKGLALPPEPEVGPLVAHVSTKGSCVDPSATDPDTGDSNKCGLYIEENPSCLVALGRVYEGSTAVHNIPLLHGQVRVGVEEVKDADAPVPVPTDEVAMSPAKPTDGPDPQSLQVMWDVIVFVVFKQDFPLYIKHEDLSEIPDSGQCLSISVIQLWILHPTKTSMRAGNSDVYGFLEPQSIHRSGQSESYMKSWMQNSKCDVYLRAYLNGPDNYLKRIINRSALFFNTFALVLLNNINILMFFVFNTALKGLDDTPQPKSKAGARWIVVKCNRQKGSTECGYYVMHWMSTIILGSFRNNCETYFNDVRPLEAKRLKALRIQWAQYYLKVRNQT
ncbi:hypothetical protein HKD37_01G001516 [Glycine soja]